MFFLFNQQSQTNSPHENKFGQNLSQIGALYDFYGQKHLGRHSSGIELNCSRNVVLAWKQSVRSNWSNAKIRRANLHLIFQNTTEPISTKIDRYRASASAFHLGVQNPSVAYRESSCIATKHTKHKDTRLGNQRTERDPVGSP